VNVPGVLDVGVVRVKFGLPKVFVSPLQVNVGFALPTVTVIVVVPPEIYLVESSGVNVAVISEVPAPTTVAELPLTEMTEVVAEEYVKVPDVLGVGAMIGKTESPNIFVTGSHV
jgi:hypothetical protein